MNTKLRDKLIKNSKSEYTDSLDESKFFNNRDEILTMVPMLNVALSGHLDGGLKAGITMFAGPSKHFKTGLALICAEAFLKKYPDAIMLFYDSEAGAPKSYFESMNIDTSRVVHTVIKNIEELKFDIVSQLENLSRDDKVVIVIDSIGNLASKKEIEDAINEKSVADMTRAKALKSLFRIVTPYLNVLDIPMLVINHTYKEIGLFPKDIVGGGCVVAGTKIRMADGTLKEIENISIGELIKTKDSINTVTHVWNPASLNDGTPECLEIEFEDGCKVICSENHRFLVNDNWIEARDLFTGIDVSVV